MNWPDAYHAARGDADAMADALSTRMADHCNRLTPGAVAELSDSAIVVCMGQPGTPCGVLLGYYCAAGHRHSFEHPMDVALAESELHCECGLLINVTALSHGLCQTCEALAYEELAASCAPGRR